MGAGRRACGRQLGKGVCERCGEVWGGVRERPGHRTIGEGWGGVGRCGGVSESLLRPERSRRCGGVWVCERHLRGHATTGDMSERALGVSPLIKILVGTGGR